ncbi:dihydroneopterin aldolase [Rhodobacteraceae bacterium W635]|uniref:dihydroneopterin aldolase n=1 Tax=Nioella halotolerans TaxID=2303578 RepID=UPI000E3CA3FA|nr:dihydroneopterin aldolase [Rhodobacteraceae bacterium W635]
MSDETRLAFAHPSERAKATAGPDPLDRISLSDHEREVEIGAFQQERGLLQRVRFNVVVEVRSAADAHADDVDRILSYDTIVEAIDVELQAERLNLLETLAARIAERILVHPLAARCFVRIEKLDRGPFALGVEIVRSAPERPHLSLLKDGAPHPLVVFLSNAAIARDDLPALLDRLEMRGAPLILCVGRPDAPVPEARHAMPQRRIDLLAIEQNAWILASRDDRCVVVDSRTELDWAMKHGRISVWAPSKLVLDSVEGPGPGMRSGEDLAQWLARSFEAEGMLFFGGSAPGADIALTVLDARAMPDP